MTRDNEARAIVAEAILRGQALLLATVVLEAVWVLKRGYRWSPEAIVAGFDVLLETPKLECPDKAAIRWALARYLSGADFADMLHLALSAKATSFAIFDKGIARHADASVVPVETLA